MLGVSSWKFKGTPPLPLARNEALLGDYWGMMVVNDPFIRPDFPGGVALGGALKFSWWVLVWKQCQLRRPPSGLFFWWGDFGELQWKKKRVVIWMFLLAMVNWKITTQLRPKLGKNCFYFCLVSCPRHPITCHALGIQSPSKNGNEPNIRIPINQSGFYGSCPVRIPVRMLGGICTSQLYRKHSISHYIAHSIIQDRGNSNVKESVPKCDYATLLQKWFFHHFVMSNS